MATRRFIPALGYRALNRLYDPLVRLTTPEDEIRNRLVDRMALRSREQVLDVGCGTGSLALLIGRRQPDAEVTGIDPDDSILRLARRKAESAGARVRFEVAFADQLPFADGSFDVAVSSLVFHHLPEAAQPAALAEMFRVLKPSGRLYIADSTGHSGLLGHLASVFGGFHGARDQGEWKLPALIRRSGFTDVTESQLSRTHMGPLLLCNGRRP